jgi:hypothetical protein
LIMKWESVIAGLAALGGLIVITKTPLVKREAETIVFNARALPTKIRVEGEKTIKNPFLKQILDYESDPVFAFGYADPEIKNDKWIGMRYWNSEREKININISNGPLSYSGTPNERNGHGIQSIAYQKPWSADLINQRIDIFITALPILKQLEKDGYGVEETLRKLSHHKYDVVMAYQKITKYPEWKWERRDLEIAFDGRQNLVSKWEEYLITKNVPQNGIFSEYANASQIGDAIGRLGRYMLQKMGEEEQFEYELECRYQMLLIDNNKLEGFQSINGSRYDFDSLKQKTKIEITEEDALLIVELWMITQNFWIHEAYESWTKEWEQKGYNFDNPPAPPLIPKDMPVLVNNIRGTLDLYRFRVGSPNRYNWKQYILGSQALKVVSYSQPFIYKRYLKKRAIITARQKYFADGFNKIFAENLIQGGSEAKRRLLDAVKETPPFVNYDKIVKPDLQTSLIIESYEWYSKVSEKIKTDLNLAKDELSDQEKRDIFAAYEQRIAYGMQKYDARKQDEFDEFVAQRKALQQRNKEGVVQRNERNEKL